MKKKKIIILSIMIIVVALLLEASILKYVNDRNAHRTSKVLLDRVITVLNKNDKSKNELIKSLKDDYIVRAKAVSYIIDANPEIECDVDELQEIAKLMAIDEMSWCLYGISIVLYNIYIFQNCKRKIGKRKTDIHIKYR